MERSAARIFRLRIALALSLCALGLAGTVLTCSAPAVPASASGAAQPLAAQETQEAPARRAALPESTSLDVEGVLQLPELPNGCEATSLAILLRYYGYDADKMEIAFTYLPRTEFVTTWFGVFGGDPETSYCGDPAGTGYYCFAAPLKEAADRYLADQGSALRAADRTGCSVYDLRALLAGGAPVVVWGTIDWQPIEMSERTWLLYSDGSVYRPMRNLHCLVLTGYDETSYTVYDPLEGAQRIPAALFETRWREMGSRALSLEPALSA